MQVDARGTLDLAFRALPSARRVLVAGGSSRFDRSWQRIVREELQRFDPSLRIEYDVDSSLPDLTRKVATLPSDTFVLYTSMTLDGAGVPQRPVDVLQTLRDAAQVPIFGVSSTYLGVGALGGAVLDFDRHGADLGHRAADVLGGASPPPMTTPAIVQVDWREVQRFSIPAERLPPSTVILFRKLSLWQRQKGTLLTVAGVVVAQSALIVALFLAGRRRRAAQRQLEGRVRFERLLSDLSVSLATVAPAEVDAALDTALREVAATLGIDWVLRWQGGRADDATWDSSRLGAGEPVVFDAVVDLPPSVARQLRAAGAGACSALGLPLLSSENMGGAIFWVRRDPASSWSEDADNLRVVSAVAETVVQRKQAELALEGSLRFKGAILDSLPANIAVLDRGGVIIATNHAWSEFGHANAIVTPPAVGPEIDYLAACRVGARAGIPAAAEAVALIESACCGEPAGSHVEYRCDAPEGPRWFLMTAQPLRRAEGGAVVTHWDISRLKANEIALKESEDRFRRLADALPVAVWMSDASGDCTYCNKEWLVTTGRSLEEELGDGWLESVHPDERALCMDAYLRALHLREGFRIEYRVLRHNEEYRWFLDTGVPRYGSDGAFLGYVGGCVDITDRKDAEHMLRDLSHRLMQAQDDERRRIARELHDNLSQQLALLAISLQQLTIEPVPSIEASVPALQEAWRRTTEIASDVHAMSHRLHPSKMEVLGLVATVQAHCREVSRQSLTVHFRHESVPAGLSPDWALTVFRVIQEALSNAARHSGANEAHVSLVGLDTELVLRVADDGIGFVIRGNHGGGLGLVSMRERLQSLDGILSITSVPGKGTVVEARVPVANALRVDSPPDSVASTHGPARRASDRRPYAEVNSERAESA
jgi:PAS domain S-box-containing protein